MKSTERKTAVPRVPPIDRKNVTELVATPISRGLTETYDITVTSKRDSNAVTFTLARASDGTMSRTCATGSAGKGGCSAQAGGTW